MSIASQQYASKSDEPKSISWEVFEAKYLHREDTWKYEWVNGVVEKTKRAMHEKHFNILANLRSFFIGLLTSGKASGYLEAEIDIFFKETIHRRPDLAYFSEEQRVNMAHGEMEIPKFVIEIISTTDQMTLVHRKMRNYREAQVQVVWHIFPELEEVHVYQGNTMTVCFGEMLCSATKVVPDFQLPAHNIFKLPKK